MKTNENIDAAIVDFLIREIEDLFYWKPPHITEPIGPQKPDVYDDYYAIVTDLIDLASLFLREKSAKLMSASAHVKFDLQSEWVGRFSDEIQKIRKSMPNRYEGGFGEISDLGGYKTYCAMDYWSLVEAFWISFGLVPEQDKSQTFGRLHKEQSKFVVQRRELMSRSWPDSQNYQEKVSPVQFCQWILEKQIECPSLLIETVSRVHGVKLNSSSYGNSKSDRPLGGKERASLQKMIIGMAIKHYSYDPSKDKSEVPKKIESSLDRLGLGVSAETIRKHLKDASKHLDDDKSQE